MRLARSSAREDVMVSSLMRTKLLLVLKMPIHTFPRKSVSQQVHVLPNVSIASLIEGMSS
jgi:hypothetical protein